MVFGLTTTTLAALLAGAFVVGVGVTTVYDRRINGAIDDELLDLEREALEEYADDDTVGFGVDGDPPDVGRNWLDVIKVWWHLRKARKMAKRGYVKWYRYDSRLHKPRWIKPEHKGAGEYEYYSKKDDVTYLFPEDSMVTDATTSAYVAIHQVGEAEPINFRDPGWAAMDGDRLQTVLDLAMAREPDSKFNLPLSGAQLKWAAIGVLFVVIYFANQMFLMGGS